MTLLAQQYNENSRLIERERLWIEYVKLLVDELNELMPLAANHGWVSTRHEKGKELRRQLGLDEHNNLIDKGER